MDDLTLRQILLHPLDVPIYPLVLFALTIAFVLVLAYLQMKRDLLDLRWLILDRPHKPSLTKIAQIVALVVSTWGFVVLTLKCTLTETYFMAYMVTWSGSAALDAYFNRGQRGVQRSTDPALTGDKPDSDRN
jgi:hypothetical protein